MPMLSKVDHNCIIAAGENKIISNIASCVDITLCFLGFDKVATISSYDLRDQLIITITESNGTPVYQIV